MTLARPGYRNTFASKGVKGAGFKLNVNDPVETEAVLGRIESEYGPVAVLVNNAGITRDNLLLRMKDAEWDEIMDTNLKAVFRLSKLVIRSMMKARFGRIINITSVVGSMGNAGQVNYAAAKAGVVGFSKSLAKEVGSRNITVNCIAPGFIDTDMTRGLPEDQKTALLAHVPLGRFGQGRGDRGGGGLSGVGRSRLCHWQHVARQRWHVHGLMPEGMQFW